MNPDFEQLAIEKASYYRTMRDTMGGGGSMYREVMWQYQDMSQGGDGGELGYWPSNYAEKTVDSLQPLRTPTCREYNYPGYPDSFFARVLNLLGEK